MIAFDDLILYDLAEVAGLLKMNRHRVEQLVRADDLAGVQHGGRWMVAAEEVVRFKRSWSPPERMSRAGTRRRFQPPPRPAD